VSLIPEDAFGARVRDRLRDGYAVWLTTVGADETPQPNPVWFLWDGAESVVVYNQSDAHRLAHVEARPNVCLHFDGDGRGGEVVVLAGRARRRSDLPAAHENAGYVAKYGVGMARVSGSLEQFSSTYSIPLQIDIRRVRGH
jgi:PPOX class probable F420-dependent enzyme